jgi:hypothetical protein
MDRPELNGNAERRASGTEQVNGTVGYTEPNIHRKGGSTERRVSLLSRNGRGQFRLGLDQIR